MTVRTKPRPNTIAMAVLGVVALLLYGWFLSVNYATVYGDAVTGQAIEALMAMALLWLVLLALVAIDRVLGGPSWPRRAGYLVIPLSAVAMTFATDYPNNALCQAGILATPFVVGLYVLAGRMQPSLAARVQVAILLLLAAFSAYAIELFVS
ncbi:MAG TPA: hypothetical protein VLM18_11240 [Croceibacterium sp.]|nr:hypothetical protein [Croceibacterium sp.]